jgi:hypothetical protein
LEKIEFSAISFFFLRVTAGSAVRGMLSLYFLHDVIAAVKSRMSLFFLAVFLVKCSFVHTTSNQVKVKKLSSYRPGQTLSAPEV